MERGKLKVIMVSGAHSGCGKTRIVNIISENLQKSFCVKIGDGMQNDAKKILLMNKNVSYEDIEKKIPPETKYLIVESNNRDLFDRIDLHIFVDGEIEKYKQNAFHTKSKADIVSGSSVDCCYALEKSRNLEINPRFFGKLLNELNIKVKKCQLGLFDK